MIYIHKLGDLSPKAAEIESVPLVREFRKQLTFPLVSERIHDLLDEFFPSETDIAAVQRGIERLEPTLKILNEIKAGADPCYEMFNVTRAINMVTEVQKPLDKSLAFMMSMQVQRDQWLAVAMSALNGIPTGDKYAINEQLKQSFELILRNKEMSFDASTLVGEGSIETGNAMHESMRKYFLFHITLEEQIQKKNVQEILRRMPITELQRVEEITMNVEVIKAGIDRAYNANLRLIELAVMFYSLIRWVQSRIL